MKKQMKNNKGITLTSLVIYIALMFVVLAILIRIMTYYTGNLSDMADVTWDAQIEKINIYFLDEAQKLGNKATIPNDNDNEISFSSGNRYTFIEEERTLYLNDSIKICDNLYYCEFDIETAANGKTVVIVNVTRVEGELAKTIRYVLKGENQTTTEQNTIDPLYQEVEYIESTGTQYIDTGVPQSEISEIFGEIQFTSLGSSHQAICGRYTSGYTTINLIYNANSKNINFNWTEQKGYSIIGDLNKHSFNINTNSITIDNTVVSTYSASKPSDNVSLVIFARRKDGSGTGVQNLSNLKMYAFKIKSGDSLVRDFVPCYRKAENEEDIVAGLYDKVEGKFYENAGTGNTDFNKGPDVIKEDSIIVGNNNYINEEDYIVQKEENEEILLAGKYKQVEYIESTGTQYVDTGYAPTGNVKIQGKVYTTVSNKEMAVVGSNADGIEIGYSSTTNRFFVYSSNSIGITTTESLYNTILEFTASVTTTPSKELTLHNVGDGKTQTLNSTNLKYQNVILNLFQYKNKYYFQGRLYEMKIYDNDKLVRDFVPCYLKADNEEDIVVGLYDKVEGKFYENAGTGSFVIPE